MTQIRIHDHKYLDDEYGINLVKYHISYREKKVIFFFIQRNTKKKQSVNNIHQKMTGIYYFVVKDFHELKFLSERNMENLVKLEKELNIFNNQLNIDQNRDEYNKIAKKIHSSDPSLIKGNYFYPDNVQKKDK
jgi:hypothetical protein